MFVLLSPLAAAATLTVGPGQLHTDIQSAIQAASRGDTIEVEPGTYAQSLTILKKLRIRGLGAAGDVVLRGTGNNPVVELQARAILEALTIDGQGTRQGIDAYNQSLTLVGVVVRDASDTFGGGVNLFSDTLVVRDSTFVGNEAAEGAAIYTYDSNITILDSVFDSNTATSAFAGGGGAIRASETTSVIRGNLFIDNTAPTSRGGALFLETDGPNQFQRIKGNTFASNEAALGGAAFLYARDWDTEATVHKNVFDNNSATSAGGDMYLYCQGNFYYTGFYNCQAGFGQLDASIKRNTFLSSDAPSGASIQVGSPMVDVDVTNNVFAHSTGGASVVNSAGTGVVHHNLWFDNAGGDISGLVKGVGSVSADPLFTAYSDNDDPTDDDLQPLPGSPLIDAGDPLYTDPDGSPSDIGTP